MKKLSLIPLVLLLAANAFAAVVALDEEDAAFGERTVIYPTREMP